VLVFLLAGPATDIATIAVIHRELGAHMLTAYLAGIALSSVILGPAVDALVPLLWIDKQAQLQADDEWIPEWLAVGNAVLLSVLAIRPLRRQLPFLRS
jgi:hypothetical protein